MMKKMFGVVALAAVIAAPASAQLIGNAVYPAFPGTGVRLAGDVGFSLEEEVGEAYWQGSSEDWDRVLANVILKRMPMKRRLDRLRVAVSPPGAMDGGASRKCPTAV